MGVLPSIWIAGDPSVLAERVRSGKASAQDIRAVVGSAGWAGPQLECELRRGCWIRVSAQKAGEPHTAAIQRICFQSSKTTSDGIAVWKEAVRRAGQAAFADFPRGPGAD